MERQENVPVIYDFNKVNLKIVNEKVLKHNGLLVNNPVTVERKEKCRANLNKLHSPPCDAIQFIYISL